MASKSILDVINGIQQAASNGQDHAYGGSKTDALKREEGDPIKDSRVIDGFKVKMGGNKLFLTYNSIVSMESALGDSYEKDLESQLDKLSSFLKKEYKKVTGSSLTLKEVGEFKAEFIQTSNVRMMVKAVKVYEFTGVDVDGPEDSKPNDGPEVEQLEERKHWAKFIKGGVIKG